MELFTTTVMAKGVESLSTLISIIAWIVRAIILIVGILPPLIKIASGNANGNEQERDKGLQAIIITAVIFVASFFLESFLNSALSDNPVPSAAAMIINIFN